MVDQRNGPGARGLGPDPARLRRRPARHQLGRRRPRPQELLAQRDQLLADGGRGDAPRRRRQPGRRRRPSPPSRPRSPSSWNGCEGLGFKPKLSLQMLGATRRAKNPKLKAVLSAREGDANISRAVVTLPKGLILDQSQHRESLHPDPVRGERLPGQLALRLRPRLHAAARQAARRPGPAALLRTTSCPTSSPRCHGQIDIDLAGKIDTSKGRIRNSFNADPRRAGLEIRTHRPRRQAGDPDQQPQPLPEEAEQAEEAQGRRSGSSPRTARRPATRSLRVKTPCGKKKKRK